MATRRTEESARKLVLTRILHAPREFVWRAWTSPEALQQWFKPAEGFALPSVKADVRPGGKYRIQMRRPDGEFFTVAGTYLDVKPPEKLSFTWAWEKDGSTADFGPLEADETVVTLEFRARGHQTELVLSHEEFPSDESRARHEHGWIGCLDQLATFLS